LATFGSHKPAVLWLVVVQGQLKFYKVFTPKHNTVHLSVHSSSKEHTDTWKNTKTYAEVKE